MTAPTINLNQTIKLNNATLSGTATTVNVGANGTVQNGVDVAMAAGTVNLATTTYLLSDTVRIDKNLTIVGKGLANTIVSGNNSVGVFDIASGDVAFTDLTISKGNTGGFGGGIYTNGSVILTNSSVSGNTADGAGGIYSNGNVTLTNSFISANRARSIGGIQAGGAITLTNSSVSNNSSQ